MIATQKYNHNIPSKIVYILHVYICVFLNHYIFLEMLYIYLFKLIFVAAIYGYFTRNLKTHLSSYKGYLNFKISGKFWNLAWNSKFVVYRVGLQLTRPSFFQSNLNLNPVHLRNNLFLKKILVISRIPEKLFGWQLKIFLIVLFNSFIKSRFDTRVVFHFLSIQN